MTTRLAIDELRSARARRERYIGEWLPEPILTDSADDPARHAEMADSLSMAMLVLLETLSPEQRAALLLRDVFDYRYDEIARIVDKARTTSANSRPARDATFKNDGPGSRPPPSSATSSPADSSQPRRTAISARSRHCSHTT